MGHRSDDGRSSVPPWFGAPIGARAWLARFEKVAIPESTVFPLSLSLVFDQGGSTRVPAGHFGVVSDLHVSAGVQAPTADDPVIDHVVSLRLGSRLVLWNWPAAQTVDLYDWFAGTSAAPPMRRVLSQRQPPIRVPLVLEEGEDGALLVTSGQTRQNLFAWVAGWIAPRTLDVLDTRRFRTEPDDPWP